MKARIAPVAPLLISACVLLMLSFGYRAGFGLFLKPISESHGWGREVMSMALAIQNLSWGIIAVFAGDIEGERLQKFVLPGLCSVLQTSVC